MDLHQKTIQNEGDTPFSRDLEDNTSPPKKRGKHDSDFDSSEQKPDLDFYLPKLDPKRVAQWCRMFDYRFYQPESREVFEDIITKWEKEIEAVRNASDKAKHFFMKEIAGLQKEQPSPITTDVLETILDKQKLVYGYIRKAEEMLNFVKADVDTYIEYRDDILLKCQLEWEPYFESVEQLAEIPSIDKMMKFLCCGVGNLEPIENYCDLTPLEFSVLFRILRMKSQINFEEYSEDEEQFDLNKMTEVLEANKGLMSKMRSLREAFERVDADVKKQSVVVYVTDTYDHVCRLCGFLRSAVAELKIMREQLKLLYDKNVMENGYYKLFYRDWNACPFMVVDD